MVLNILSTHGVLRLISIIYGEIIQWIRVELGLLHRGTEKLINCNYFSFVISFFDRLDYVSTVTQELLFVGALEELIKYYACFNLSLFKILLVEAFQILNHLLALTTHVIDIGLFTTMLWGFEEREKLLNYIELISGSRFHNALLAISNIKLNFENHLGFILFLFLYFLLILKELFYILSTISLFICRLYNVGIISRQLLIYFGLSGVLLRSANFYFNAKFLNYECYKNFNYFIFLGINSDCLDRFLIRFNEILNSSVITYTLLFLVFVINLFYFSNCSSMVNIINEFFNYIILNTIFYFVFILESSKGIYSIFILFFTSNFLNNFLNIISNDLVAVFQLNSFCRIYNLGNLISILGAIDFVLGSIDL